MTEKLKILIEIVKMDLKSLEFAEECMKDENASLQNRAGAAMDLSNRYTLIKPRLDKLLKEIEEQE